jgi:glutamate formiminotransferase/formiminotetrahydrofolate cyclodeaminase
MSEGKLLECVPNFSEGRDAAVIQQITEAIESVEGVRLLDVDAGKATHRTVVTFVGEPEAVIEAAFRGIRRASELIDMSLHKGEHPRMGATDVCPLIPIANMTMEEAADCARRLGERVGSELGIPVYLYEAAASRPERRNLAAIRSGEYEGLPAKLQDAVWRPDYGPAMFLPRSGATVIGARDFLVAYNVNLNTTSVRRANSVAFDVRENGRVRTGADGKAILDADGQPERIPGKCPTVKAIGWYIEEYGIAQISMNLTQLDVTPLHIAFDACCESAHQRGLRVTGSELVGLIPRRVLLEAGKYFLHKQGRSAGVSEKELVHIAVRTLGLDELGPFDPGKKVIEYVMEDSQASSLVRKSLSDFADVTASESPAPGGGSISAYVGALGVSLGTMVANLSSHKKGWDKHLETFSECAEQGQRIKEELLRLVDADTRAFDSIMAAMRLPKDSETEKRLRKDAIRAATIQAIDVPLQVMKAARASMPFIKQMALMGNPASVSDAGVGILCARLAVEGAYLNVRINCAGFEEVDYTERVLSEGQELLSAANLLERETMEIVNRVMTS